MLSSDLWHDVPAWLIDGAPSASESGDERQAPPGDALTLTTSGPFERGASVTLTASGATPGARVHFLVGKHGEGPCPAALGGECLDVQGPNIRYLGEGTASGDGVATLPFDVPDSDKIGEVIASGYSPYVQAIQVADPVSLSPAIPVNVCDSSLECAEVLTCIDGVLYPTACGDDNCDEPLASCADACADLDVSGGTCDTCDGSGCQSFCAST